MSGKNKVPLALVLAVVLGIWLALPAFAQETGGHFREQFDASGRRRHRKRGEERLSRDGYGVG